MRIGFLADLYTPHISGVTKHIQVTKRQLEAGGHQVFVFTFGPIQARPENNVFRSPVLPWGLPYGQGKLQMGLFHSRKNRQLLETMDIVHVHHPLISPRCARRCSLSRRIPTVFTYHTRYDLHLEAYCPRALLPLARFLLARLLQVQLRGFDAIVLLSRSALAKLSQLNRDGRCQIIPHGLPTPFQVIGPTRTQMGLSQRDRVLIFVGRLGPEKNLSFLLRVLSQMDQEKHLKLIMVGDGPQRPALESYSKKLNLSRKVLFTGPVGYERVPAYLSLADLFVTPSQSEVFPLSVLEAMMTGLPVVGIRAAGVGDLVDHNQTGLLVGPSRAEFSAGLAELLRDSGKRRRFGNRGRRLAARYTIEKSVSRLVALYERLLENKLEPGLPHKRKMDRFRIPPLD